MRVLLDCFADRVHLAKGRELTKGDLAQLNPKAVDELTKLGCLGVVAAPDAPTLDAGAAEGEADAPASGPSDDEGDAPHAETKAERKAAAAAKRAASKAAKSNGAAAHAGG